VPGVHRGQGAAHRIEPDDEQRDEVLQALAEDEPVEPGHDPRRIAGLGEERPDRRPQPRHRRRGAHPPAHDVPDDDRGGAVVERHEVEPVAPDRLDLLPAGLVVRGHLQALHGRQVTGASPACSSRLTSCS
jgi:hypothetical protein